jgi:hypothetical protein
MYLPREEAWVLGQCVARATERRVRSCSLPVVTLTSSCDTNNSLSVTPTSLARHPLLLCCSPQRSPTASHRHHNNMEDSHDTAPPIEPHKSTSTTIQDPLPPSDAAAGNEVSDSGSTLIGKLIGTTELCEQILGHLSCTELCRAKRVCKRFRDVIDDTLMLQQKLFLKPYNEALPEGPVKTNDPWHSMYNFHPLLTSNIAPNPQSDFRIELWPLRDHDPNDIRIYSGGTFPSMDRLIQTFEDASGVSDDSSLHKMYLSNPPLKEISLSLMIPCWCSARKCMSWESATEPPWFYSWDTWRSDKGITFGQVFDYARTVIRARHKKTFPNEHAQPQTWDSWGNWSSSVSYSEPWADWPTGPERRLWRTFLIESSDGGHDRPKDLLLSPGRMSCNAAWVFEKTIDGDDGGYKQSAASSMLTVWIGHWTD